MGAFFCESTFTYPSWTATSPQNVCSSPVIRTGRLPTGKLTAQMYMQPGYPFLEENEIEKAKKKKQDFRRRDILAFGRVYSKGPAQLHSGKKVVA